MTDALSSFEPTAALDELVARVERCRICLEHPLGDPLPHPPRPVLSPSATARLLVAGQAPGIRVHQTGIPFNDPSGDRLRVWMGVDRDTFYDTNRIAIVPMGFCFPGHDKMKGDLPPRRECRAAWHDAIFDSMPQITTILAIGRAAQIYHFTRAGLAAAATAGMTENVRFWRNLPASHPRIIPLPHPSWRNSGWLKKNPWFEREFLPELRNIVRDHIIA
jgi:uracil-DNA glycosylase